MHPGLHGVRRRSSSAALAALFMVLLGGVSARAADPVLPVESYRLPNGLTVLLSVDHRLPQVAVDVWYHVGASRQRPGRSGFAHLFEHLMLFSGTKHLGDPGYLPKDLARYRAVTPAMVRELAGRVLTHHRFVMDVEPRAAAATAPRAKP